MTALARRLRQVSAAIALTMAVASGVSAADIQRPLVRAPVVATTNWTGFYVGGHAGYGFGDPSTSYATWTYGFMNIFPRAQTAGLIPTSLNSKLDGFSGGGYAGFNWQLDRYVLGIEADVSSGMKAGSAFVSAGGMSVYPFPQLATTQDNKLEWMGTVRGRVGWLWTPAVLVFGSGGFAYGSAKASTQLATVPSLATSPCPGNAYCSLGSDSGTLIGWVAGAGIEYAIDPNWRARIEYQHFDLGSLQYDLQNASFVTGEFARPYMNATARFYGDIVRAGISYKFN